MDKPNIYKKQAIGVNLEPGKYFYCRCGLSLDQPFCDGAHEGTLFSPKRFKVEEPTKAYLCLCKHTNNAPFCDGAHNNLK